jgi:hypothetical protein
MIPDFIAVPPMSIQMIFLLFSPSIVLSLFLPLT